MSDSTAAVFFSQRLWCTVGAAVAGLAVIVGAFGAHLVQEKLPAIHASTEAKTLAGFKVPASYKYYEDFRTGAAYQMTHGLAIVFVGLLGRRGRARIFGHAAAGCFLGGVLLFSGSLYLLALTGLRWLGMVTPFGGLLFIAGWILFGFAAGLPRSTDARQR